ncbi:MAG: hypothetical protein AAF594_15435, partial [Bacteroidota bacterium]
MSQSDPPEDDGAADITDARLTARSAICADYADAYTASVTDVQRSVEFDADFVVVSGNGSCTFSSNAIPNHD